MAAPPDYLDYLGDVLPTECAQLILSEVVALECVQHMYEDDTRSVVATDELNTHYVRKTKRVLALVNTRWRALVNCAHVDFVAKRRIKQLDPILDYRRPIVPTLSGCDSGMRYDSGLLSVFNMAIRNGILYGLAPTLTPTSPQVPAAIYAIYAYQLTTSCCRPRGYVDVGVTSQYCPSVCMHSPPKILPSLWRRVGDRRHPATIVSIACGAAGGDFLYALERVSRVAVAVRKLRLPEAEEVDESEFDRQPIALQYPPNRHVYSLHARSKLHRGEDAVSLSGNGEVLVLHFYCAEWIEVDPWMVVDCNTGAIMFRWDTFPHCQPQCDVFCVGATRAAWYQWAYSGDHFVAMDVQTVEWNTAKGLYNSQSIVLPFQLVASRYFGEDSSADNSVYKPRPPPLSLANLMVAVHDRWLSINRTVVSRVYLEFMLHLREDIFIWIGLYADGTQRFFLVDFKNKRHRPLYTFCPAQTQEFTRSWTCATFTDSYDQTFVVLKAIDRLPTFLQLPKGFSKICANAEAQEQPVCLVCGAEF